MALMLLQYYEDVDIRPYMGTVAAHGTEDACPKVLLIPPLARWEPYSFAFDQKWEWTWWKLDDWGLNSENVLPLDGCSVD